ncbi:hypothetical protein OB894_21205 [Bacillus subtilis]|nr:hypothetical protein [Bacillus subtilis]KIN30716.1 hypothetical protein B4069_2407 [Bacillus subtilis]KIN31985.1 hypothetical protein B4068_2404 [Bacillus subtilis]KIN37161.1 hypothetical protein B4071_2167 [Bacillus subtilis]KIN40538.1 hypothetical protein B4070_2186 [Bacillus subtilis]KIN45665.1 hypothetical protein B4072_2420 [Bacillus subtilis]
MRSRCTLKTGMDRMTEQESTSLRKSVYAGSWTAYSVLREF